MSRIGKMPIDLPQGVKVEIDGSDVSVSGDKGKLTQKFHPEMGIKQENGSLGGADPFEAVFEDNLADFVDRHGDIDSVGNLVEGRKLADGILETGQFSVGNIWHIANSSLY